MMKVTTCFRGTREVPSARGKIENIDESNFTPEDMTYGFLEGMASELYELYEKIYKGTGIKTKRITASGNGLRKNPVLQEICREKFGMDLELARCREEAACGAAVGAMYALEAPFVLIP